MTALMLADNEGTGTRVLKAAMRNARSRARRSDGGVAKLISERASLSRQIMASPGQVDLAVVARFEDVTRAIEASMVVFRERRVMKGASQTH